LDHRRAAGATFRPRLAAAAAVFIDVLRRAQAATRLGGDAPAIRKILDGDE
jgi:hypothetical protein